MFVTLILGILSLSIITQDPFYRIIISYVVVICIRACVVQDARNPSLQARKPDRQDIKHYQLSLLYVCLTRVRPHRSNPALVLSTDSPFLSLSEDRPILPDPNADLDSPKTETHAPQTEIPSKLLSQLAFLALA